MATKSDPFYLGTEEKLYHYIFLCPAIVILVVKLTYFYLLQTMTRLFKGKASLDESCVTIHLFGVKNRYILCSQVDLAEF